MKSQDENKVQIFSGEINGWIELRFSQLYELLPQCENNQFNFSKFNEGEIDIKFSGINDEKKEFLKFLKVGDYVEVKEDLSLFISFSKNHRKMVLNVRNSLNKNIQTYPVWIRGKIISLDQEYSQNSQKLFCLF